MGEQLRTCRISVMPCPACRDRDRSCLSVERGIVLSVSLSLIYPIEASTSLVMCRSGYSRWVW